VLGERVDVAQPTLERRAVVERGGAAGGILREVTILDCSHRNTGSHGQSTFGIDAQSRAERLRDSEIPFDAQKQREVMMEILRRVDDVERRLRQLLMLLLLLLLLGLWAALGPLFF
jgi:hypothetical protein